MAIPVAVVADLSASMGFEGAPAQARRAGRLRREPGVVGLAQRRQLRLRRLRRGGARRAAAAADARARRAASRWPPRCARWRPPAARRRGCWRRTGTWRASARCCSWSPTSTCRCRGRCARARQPGRPRGGAGRAVAAAGVRARARARASRDVIDPESGQRRAVWWRPSLRARWQAAQRDRRDALLGEFRSAAARAAGDRGRVRCRCRDAALPVMSALAARRSRLGARSAAIGTAAWLPRAGWLRRARRVPARCRSSRPSPSSRVPSATRWATCCSGASWCRCPKGSRSTQRACRARARAATRWSCVRCTGSPGGRARGAAVGLPGVPRAAVGAHARDAAVQPALRRAAARAGPCASMPGR